VILLKGKAAVERKSHSKFEGLKILIIIKNGRELI